jgi:chemotaxis protein histidine kinase CheA
MSFPSDDFGLASNSLDDWSLLINTDLLNIENEAAPGPGYVIKQEAPSFNEPVKTQSSLLLPRQQMRGPTHNYSEYRQATSIVVDPLALQTTLQATQNTGYNFYDPIDTSMVDQDANIYNTAVPSFPDNLSVSPLLPQLGESPQATSANNSFASEPSTPLVQNNSQVRCYPGIHSQQQAARYQSMEQRAQQVQEEQRWMQRQQSQELFTQPSQAGRSQMMGSPPAPTLSAGQSLNPSATAPAKDPLRERVINQVLSDLRNAASLPAASVASDDLDRLRKEAKEEEDDMDPDAKLLNSEEGKKLPAMKRRQLRNKVSARAFRSRRKGKNTLLLA